MKGWIGPLAVGLTMALLGTAQAAPQMTKCPPPIAGTGNAGLGVIDVRRAGSNCKTARHVARKSDGRTSVDLRGNVWSCRVTRHATGTDPGYYPYTHVSCRRGTRALVRFKWSS